ncbi:hypothetical protein A2X44_03370 [candidate division CPR3 bacterium GWF2_35_18]|uniref:DUF2304 domain-containing protein n=1 Tax=candidate division CPR3 bacterium GW2011_GWF2_35_18 TaxID=1618350 RepID=A0A0G0EQE2_UNCC3|nr:MAG: hypothetical protein UR67_C0005G0036 [candidate division CPR3 bacterium GW2011_GWF2_35_18]OGB63019.1 MAG: hypothetical protein A2X44_03370 [candidate division CPR3 bacterium GWF2_35_18]OGB63957.1 MAG: hypothetical protein A2250_02835 [candidate division CPR3 bacterium RIFOXYA2_FULL_35_13]OGB76132.1 MAG: hypothetical protein A2476_04485 [candidate division CPR3 bacterium RIFOXYC2_FULL_35_7]OGB78409.1 MAG: hypothetical protein A2296_03515 [candidate division CPR3 bacterium RIFOXYB2_FULL_3
MFLQIVVSIFVAAVLLEIWVNYKKHQLSILSFIFWSCIWSAVVLVVWFADVTVLIANLINIQRGIDSVVYLSIVVLFYLVFRIILKLEKIEKRIETVVRKKALHEK